MDKRIVQKMNTIPVSAIFVLLLAAVAGAQATGALSIANLNIVPNPVVAGNTASITFQLYNNYDNDLSNVNLELEGSYPLLNFSPSNSYIIDTVDQGLYGNINTYLSYSIKVPKTTPTGVYTLDIVATYQTSEVTQSAGVSYTQDITGESEIPITLYVHGVPEIAASATSVGQVNPGTPFTVSFSIQNAGGGEAKNLSIMFMSTNAFKVTGTSQDFIGILPGNSAAQAAETYTASQGIENGTYYIPLNISYESDTGGSQSETINVPISVVLSQPDLVVSIAGSMPSQLYRGYNQSVSLLVQNIGYGTARNATISISSLGNTTISGSVSKFFIGVLPSGGSVEENTFVSTTSQNNATLVAKANYYSDNYKNNYSKAFTLNLTVAPTAQFSVVSVSSPLAPGSTNVPVTYEIKNTGNIAASGIEVSMQSIYPITPIDSNAYVAELLPDESANVTFLVSVASAGVPGNYPVSIYEQWKQPNGTPNQVYAGSQDYFISVSSVSGISSGYMTSIGVMVVVVIVAIAFAMSRRRKQKK